MKQRRESKDFMAKTFHKTPKKTPKPATEVEDTAYFIREDLEGQQQQTERTSDSADLTKTSTSSIAASPSGAPDPIPAKPLAPLASMWPSTQVGMEPCQTSGGPEEVVTTTTFQKPAPTTVSQPRVPPASSQDQVSTPKQ